MTAAGLLDWYNAIFFIPMAASALLLILSSIRFGTHHGHSKGVGHSHGHSSTGGMHHASAARHHSGSKSVRTQEGDALLPIDIPHTTTPWLNLFGALFGIGRAPAIMVGELFFMAFGLIGLTANSLLIHTPSPWMIAVVPSLFIAVLGAGLVARLSAALFTRLMPEDATAIVSRDGLFGMSGTVVYPVSATGGRIHVYDEFGTLHDEACRSLPGVDLIPRGQKVRVADISPSGTLIVEEA